MSLKAMFNTPVGVVREMDRLFDSMVSSQPFGSVPSMSQLTYPAMNVWEDEDHIFAEAELPGMKMKDLEVLVSADQMTVRGSRSIDVPNDARALRRERAIGSFERTVALPIPVDAEQVEATLNHGVLTIKMHKAAITKPRRIEVKALSSS